MGDGKAHRELCWVPAPLRMHRLLQCGGTEVRRNAAQVERRCLRVGAEQTDRTNSGGSPVRPEDLDIK